MQEINYACHIIIILNSLKIAALIIVLHIL